MSKQELYFIGLGEYRLIDFYETPEEAEAHMNLNWHNVLKVFTVLYDKLSKTNLEQMITINKEKE